MAKFIISTDSCVDLFKSYLNDNNVYCITMRRVLDGKEISEHFDSEAEFDAFYDTIKDGARPTTVALNPFELEEHFEQILKKEKTGDIIHVCLSSGLSVTYDNAVKAAETVNAKTEGRKVHIVDSLIATYGMAQLVDRLIGIRNQGATCEEAIEKITYIRDHSQAWIIMSDLFHLKRGGRISGVKATIGTILNIKPVVIVNQKGKLAIENRMKGHNNAIKYALSKMEEFGEKYNKDFATSTVYVVRTSNSKQYEDFKTAVKAKYPNINMVTGAIGPIIGTHLGLGGMGVLFEGARRLDVSDK